MASKKKSQELAGKYLVFSLGTDTYGIPINKVKEIITMIPITNLPHSPEYVQGIINLKGTVIPLLDLRRRLNMDTIEYTDRTCVIVVRCGEEKTGLLGLAVDHVSEVMAITTENIDVIPEFKGAVNIRYIMGIAKLAGNITILLDIDTILDEDELLAFMDDIDNQQQGKN